MPKQTKQGKQAGERAKLATAEEMAERLSEREGKPVTARQVAVLAHQGMPVAGDQLPRLVWEGLTQAEAAVELEISTRRVRELEHRGLPTMIGDDGKKYYAWPGIVAWYETYVQRYGRHYGMPVRPFPLRDCWLEWNRSNARERLASRRDNPEWYGGRRQLPRLNGWGPGEILGASDDELYPVTLSGSLGKCKPQSDTRV